MNIYDRDYIRDDPPGRFGGPRTMVTNLVLINAAVYLVQVLFFNNDPLFVRLFGLHPDLFRHPEHFYQLLTYGFVHSPNDIWHILGNMLVLWFLGPDVEGIYGKRAFLWFYLSTVILSGLAWVLVEPLFGGGTIPVVGASGGISGVVALYALHFPRRMIMVMFVIPMPMWVAAVLFLGMDSLGLLRQDTTVAHSAHLGGAALGLLYYKTRWDLTSLYPAAWISRLRQRKAGVRLHQPAETPDDDEAELKAEVDRILEKISQHGEASLTAAERRKLEDASRRYQKRKGK
ncbi:MAG: rhomboid family intramembrane serine protease [Planctomycetia bacterium]|nr:rhomboid family intramembrane serine protease [Planctomycetia bacterium]